MISPYVYASQRLVTMHTFSYCTQSVPSDVVTCDHQPRIKGKEKWKKEKKGLRKKNNILMRK